MSRTLHLFNTNHDDKGRFASGEGGGAGVGGNTVTAEGKPHVGLHTMPNGTKYMISPMHKNQRRIGARPGLFTPYANPRAGYQAHVSHDSGKTWKAVGSPTTGAKTAYENAMQHYNEQALQNFPLAEDKGLNRERAAVHGTLGKPAVKPSTPEPHGPVKNPFSTVWTPRIGKLELSNASNASNSSNASHASPQDTLMPVTSPYDTPMSGDYVLHRNDNATSATSGGTNTSAGAIQLANPNHDDHGRFASGGEGSGSVGHKETATAFAASEEAHKVGEGMNNPKAHMDAAKAHMDAAAVHETAMKAGGSSATRHKMMMETHKGMAEEHAQEAHAIAGETKAKTAHAASIANMAKDTVHGAKVPTKEATMKAVQAAHDVKEKGGSDADAHNAAKKIHEEHADKAKQPSHSDAAKILSKGANKASETAKNAATRPLPYGDSDQTVRRNNYVKATNNVAAGMHEHAALAHNVAAGNTTGSQKATHEQTAKEHTDKAAYHRQMAK